MEDYIVQVKITYDNVCNNYDVSMECGLSVFKQRNYYGMIVRGTKCNFFVSERSLDGKIRRRLKSAQKRYKKITKERKYKNTITRYNLTHKI